MNLLKRFLVIGFIALFGNLALADVQLHKAGFQRSAARLVAQANQSKTWTEFMTKVGFSPKEQEFAKKAFKGKVSAQPSLALEGEYLIVRQGRKAIRIQLNRVDNNMATFLVDSLVVKLPLNSDLTLGDRLRYLNAVYNSKTDTKVSLLQLFFLPQAHAGVFLSFVVPVALVGGAAGIPLHPETSPKDPKDQFCDSAAKSLLRALDERQLKLVSINQCRRNVASITVSRDGKKQTINAGLTENVTYNTRQLSVKSAVDSSVLMHHRQSSEANILASYKYNYTFDDKGQRVITEPLQVFPEGATGDAETYINEMWGAVNPILTGSIGPICESHPGCREHIRDYVYRSQQEFRPVKKREGGPRHPFLDNTKSAGE